MYLQKRHFSLTAVQLYVDKVPLFDCCGEHVYYEERKEDDWPDYECNVCKGVWDMDELYSAAH